MGSDAPRTEMPAKRIVMNEKALMQISRANVRRFTKAPVPQPIIEAMRDAEKAHADRELNPKEALAALDTMIDTILDYAKKGGV